MAQPDFSTLLTKKYDEPADIVKAWRLLLFNSLDHSQVPADMLATIQKMSLEMPIPSMENWAGCESIAHIELQGSNLIVRVNKERFDELNRIKVQEFVKIAHTNEKSEISVGVGEYQIFRIEEAFRSLSFKGEQIRVTVVDNHDEQELLPTYKIAQENESIVQKLDQE